MVPEDGSEDGCIFWTDESGIRWCKDVTGVYGASPGSLWYVSQVPSTCSGDEWKAGDVEEVWVSYYADSCGGNALEGVGQGFEGEQGKGWGRYSLVARGGGGYRCDDVVGVCSDDGDGAIYWRDEGGTLWCRDRYGVHGGGQGAEYFSPDGGSVWYGEGEGWVEFSEDALEYLGTTMARKVRAKAAQRAQQAKSYSSSFFTNATHTHKQRAPYTGAVGDSDSAERGAGQGESDGGQAKVKVDGADTCAPGSAPADWQNERGVLKGHTSVKVDDARYCELYGGQQAAARVRAEEARLNAAFDRALRLAPAPLWPELPIRL